MFAGRLPTTRPLVNRLYSNIFNRTTVSIGLKQPSQHGTRILHAPLSTITNHSQLILNRQKHLEGSRKLLTTSSLDNQDKAAEPTTDAIINITFKRPDGSKVHVKTSQGKTLYDAVIDNNVDIDGFGACGGTLCCTTCHLIFKPVDYEKVGEPRDEEKDMLELAHGLEDTSRLGCQVILKRDFDPLEVVVPENINDVREL